ncbi:MAG: DUF1080 domain-containing protein [Chloroflexia bacterium]|nr:DUF1080 domain-containing protein [Chloroflexia bacterium]
MNKIILASFAFLSSLMIMEGCSTAKTSQNSGNTSPSKTINLFNGKNLDGWYTFIKDRGRDTDPKKVFTVDSGQIRVSGEEYGCITTQKEYGNYKLTAEFRWGKKTFAPRTNNARDNGILLHSTGKDGGSGGIWMHSIECQVIEGGTGDFIVVGDESEKFALSATVSSEKQGESYVFAPQGDTVTIYGGRINWVGRDPEWKDVKGFRGKNDVEKPVGKWNRIECIVRGNEITILLNGKLVNHAIRVKPSKGRIQIQSEGAETFFRRIDLEELEQ